MSVPASTPRKDRDPNEIFLGALVAILVTIVAILEGSLLVPRMGRYGTSTADTWSLNGQCIALVCLWLGLLGNEFAHRHERDWSRKTRKWIWGVQAAILALCVLANWEKAPWAPAVALFLAVMAMSAWSGYMKALALHPEDQKVLDQIIEQDRQRKREKWEEEQRSRRASRLAEAAALYGRELDVDPDELNNPLPPGVHWNIPARKHAPLIYFLRNGNRIKIGTTTDLKRRIRNLALRPEHVVLLEPGGRDKEREFHNRFAKYRDGNTEWFRHTGDLGAYLRERVAAVRSQQKASSSGSPDQ